MVNWPQGDIYVQTGVEGRDDDDLGDDPSGGHKPLAGQGNCTLGTYGGLVLRQAYPGHVRISSCQHCVNAEPAFLQIQGKADTTQCVPSNCRYTAFKGNQIILKAFCRNVLWADFQAGCRRFDPGLPLRLSTDEGNLSSLSRPTYMIRPKWATSVARSPIPAQRTNYDYFARQAS